MNCPPSCCHCSCPFCHLSASRILSTGGRILDHAFLASAFATLRGYAVQNVSNSSISGIAYPYWGDKPLTLETDTETSRLTPPGSMGHDCPEFSHRMFVAAANVLYRRVAAVARRKGNALEDAGGPEDRKFPSLGAFGPSQPACSKARSLICLPDSGSIIGIDGIICQAILRPPLPPIAPDGGLYPVSSLA